MAYLSNIINFIRQLVKVKHRVRKVRKLRLSLEIINGYLGG